MDDSPFREHREPAPGTRLTATCPHCGMDHEVAASLKGGVVNCPGCGEAFEIPSGAEPAFWLLLLLGIVFVLGLTAALWAVGGPVAGVVTLVIAGGLLALIVACS